jgi:predicted nucleic acid-binding protein
LNRVLVDSGFLVALGIQGDPRHRAARQFLERYEGRLLVPEPVIVETCFFLSTAGKVRLLDWVRKAPCAVHGVPADAYPVVAAILTRYADLDPDFTDAAMVWLAGKTGCRSILTVDVRDFSAYRLAKGKRFELVKWGASPPRAGGECKG